jgi:YidC/Oxa1 family membrane protein insertase
MNPQPTDPQQAKIMMIMPIMFTFMFASFPAGLVIYWTWSNLLTMIQQLYINHSAKSHKHNDTRVTSKAKKNGRK